MIEQLYPQHGGVAVMLPSTGTPWHGAEEPRDLLHGQAQKILAQKILARPSIKHIGTEKDWHSMARNN